MTKPTKTIYHKAGILSSLLLLIFFASSCKETLSDVNTNQNDPTKAATSFLMTNVQKDLADNYWGEFPLGYFGNLYSQYWSENQYTEESRYQYRSGVVNNIWDVYYESLNDLKEIIQINQNNPNAAAAYGNNANQIAAAKILKVWTYQTLTDIWGSIPYNESLKGAANSTPAYDSQQEIYAALIDTLKMASQAINVDEPVFNSGDILFNGNAKKWKKFANSLIMRLAIREADAAPDEAQKAFKFAYNNGNSKAMTSNADNALFGYKRSAPNNNPINQAYKTRDDFGVSKTLLSFMNNNNDPRRGAYADPADAKKDGTGGTPGNFIGFPYGMDGSQAKSFRVNNNYSRPSIRVRQATAPAIFMTYSEVLFNEAEAAQRGWISANPAQLYKEAIQASMDYWGVDSGEAQDYISNHPYQPNNWRKNLGRQKWVALYMQGIQGWSVARRLNIDILIPPVGGKLGVSFDKDVAVRYPYPTQEHQLNQKNVKEAISNQNFSEDDQGQLLWWDEAAQGK